VDRGSDGLQGSKGAVRLLTKTAAAQYAPENIRVNSVHPGIITTPMIDEGLTSEQRQAIAALAPMKREGKPQSLSSYAASL
jgi:cyclopentanol dehydrogenase